MTQLLPITLPYSEFIKSITTFINEYRQINTLEATEIVTDFVDSCRIGKVDTGKGIVLAFKVTPLPVKDLSKTSSAFNVTLPNVAEEVILIDKYKFIPLSISETLVADSVTQRAIVSTFLNFVQSLMDDTKQFYLFNMMLENLLNWVPQQASQTISIDQIDTTTLSGLELQVANTWNANQIAMVMRKTQNNMKIPNSKFTDIPTFVDNNTGETVNVVSALRGDNMKLVFNDKYFTEIIANSLATLYHGEKIEEMIPKGRFVLLPEDAINQANEKTIAWLSQKEKFALADFYTLTTSINDPSNLFTNIFLHFSTGDGVFKYAVGAKFVAKILTPVQAMKIINKEGGDYKPIELGEQITEAPVEQTSEAPVEQTSEAPVEQTSEAPVIKPMKAKKTPSKVA